MANSDKPGKKFRWKRFIVTFIIIGIMAELGGRENKSPVEPSLQIANEVGRVLGVLIFSLVVYGIDSLILRRRRKMKAKANPSQPTSERGGSSS